jgi:hypothetical protein
MRRTTLYPTVTFVGLLFLMVSLVLATPGTARAEVAAQQGQWCWISADTAHLRRDPTQYSPLLSRLSYGASVNVLGQGTSPRDRTALWYHVQVQTTGRMGWVYSELVACDTPTNDVTPDQAVRDYYDLVHWGEYQLAWATLSPAFRARVNKNDYRAYTRYWDSVENVSVLVTAVPVWTPTRAIVEASMSYRFIDGRLKRDPRFRFYLMRASTGGWLIDRTEYF